MNAELSHTEPKKLKRFGMVIAIVLIFQSAFYTPIFLALFFIGIIGHIFFKPNNVKGSFNELTKPEGKLKLFVIFGEIIFLLGLGIFIFLTADKITIKPLIQLLRLTGDL